MDIGSLGGLGGGSSGPTSKEFGRSSAEVTAISGGVNSGNAKEWLPLIVLAGLGVLVVLAILRK